MKKIFSNYYKIILSVVILIVLVALKEDYKTSFDEMSGVRTVVRMLPVSYTHLTLPTIA
mgnify:CR=1 FL=1